MKYIGILIIFLLFGCQNKGSHEKSDCIFQKEVIIADKEKKSQQSVSSIYKKSLNKLDSIIDKKLPFDHADAFKAVGFLSEISDYAGSGSNSYYGIIGFNKEDLDYWKEWYEKNKDTLNYIYQSKDTLHFKYN
ncbi:MAG: hypothetical protein CVU03_13745 [Bacteroidetes bacterium HGW-Bacteroidetes-2]|jgi:hypothetical protein|nr:MAG: hypothetical protein CVU03_13745 [Bacteroidetes bacterium HGW-Bacteroidetes-2]